MANQLPEQLWRVLAVVEAWVCSWRERKEKVFAFAWTGKEEGRSTWLVNGNEWAAVQSWSSTMTFVVFVNKFQCEGVRDYESE